MLIAISSILLFPSNSDITSIAKSSHKLLYAILQNTFAFILLVSSIVSSTGYPRNVYISSLLSPRSALIISATCSTFHRHRTMYLFLVSLPFNILVSDSLLFCVVRSTETAELPQLFHHIRRWLLSLRLPNVFTIHFLHISHMNWYLVWWRVESGDHLSISFAYPRLITNNSFRYIVVDSSFICHFRLLYLSATIAILSLAVVQSCGSHTRAELVGGKSRCGQASCETPQALISSTISYQRDTNKPSAS